MTSRALITAALLALFPHLGPAKAKLYAFLIKLESERSGVAVKYIVGRTYIESRFRNVKSKRFGCRWRKLPGRAFKRGPVYYCRQSHGLMQPEITPVTNPEYIGFEEELMNPAINFRIGAAALGYWQNWHKREKCKQRPRHKFWHHFKWGYRVPKKVLKHRGTWKMERFMKKWQRTIHKLRRSKRRSEM